MTDFIGQKNEDGSIAQWPATDINGQSYNRPATTYGLNRLQFVVLPINFNDPARLAALRAEYAPKPMAEEVVPAAEAQSDTSSELDNMPAKPKKA